MKNNNNLFKNYITENDELFEADYWKENKDFQLSDDEGVSAAEFLEFLDELTKTSNALRRRQKVLVFIKSIQSLASVAIFSTMIVAIAVAIKSME